MVVLSGLCVDCGLCMVTRAVRGGFLCHAQRLPVCVYCVCVLVFVVVCHRM